MDNVNKESNAAHARLQDVQASISNLRKQLDGLRTTRVRLVDIDVQLRAVELGRDVEVGVADDIRMLHTLVAIGNQTEAMHTWNKIMRDTGEFGPTTRDHTWFASIESLQELVEEALQHVDFTAQDAWKETFGPVEATQELIVERVTNAAQRVPVAKEARPNLGAPQRMPVPAPTKLGPAQRVPKK